MKKAIEFFVNNPLFSDLLTVFIIGVGIVSAFLIRREAFPTVTFDVVSITTIWPGAAADDVEKLITNSIEQDLLEVDGVEKIQSQSLENLSIINVFLDPDQITEEEGKTDVQDVIDKINDLPEDAEEPDVALLDTSMVPIIEVNISSNDLSDLELREKARALEKEIERIPGVARVVHRGLRDLEVRVEISPTKLSSYRLSLQEVVTALSNQNVSVPGGVIEPSQLSEPEKFIRTVGEFETLEDVENTVIRSNDLGNPIRVKDVAKVFYDLERAETLNRTNGKNSLALTVLKQEKADAVKLVEDVRTRLDDLESTLLSGLGVTFINDLSEYVTRRLGVLSNNLAVGLILILLFLPVLVPFRFSLVISIGLPLAFLGTIFVLYNIDISINLLTMVGLIIVSGILVDDSIVVTENAARLIDEGLPPREAAVQATTQIAPALVASVMTTAFAFLPMMFMTGIFGKFIKYVPMALLIALAFSLFEAFFILPSHVANWIPANSARDGRRPGLINRIYGPIRRNWEEYLVPRFIGLLKVCLRWRYLVLLGTTLLFIGCIFLVRTSMKIILFPAEGIEIFFIRTEMPVGTSLKAHGEKLKPIEKKVLELPKDELKDFTTTVGLIQQDPNDPSTERGPEFAQITVYLTPEMERERTAAEIIESLRKSIGKPEGFVRVSFQRVQGGPPTGKPVSLGVRAEEYQDILPAAEELKKLLKQIEGVTDITDSYRLGKEEIQVIPKANEALAANVNTQLIGNSVRASYGGSIATKIRRIDEEIDVRVSWPESSRQNAESVDRILVQNAQGNLIPLGRIANFSSTRNVSTHYHEDNSRQVTVSAEVDERVISALEANNKVREYLPELRKHHPNVRVEFGGEDEDTQESFMSLGRAFGVALLLIFLMLVLIFKSLAQPFLIVLTIPMGMIAIVLTFFTHGLPLSFMGLLGMIALAGVIVNNAIILVDFYNRRRAEGLDPREGILEASRQRIRPIVMTSLTTVMGILPTAYGIGGLDPFVVPIAMALGWGILLGAIMTVFIFPCVLIAADDVRRGVKYLVGK